MTPESFDLRVTTPAQVVTRPLDGELVLLNLDTETYFGLDQVGTRMWELLSSAPSVGDAFRQLVEEYDVDEATLRSDLEALLGQLVDGGLVELHAR
jgi:hypothetical protein